MWIQMKRYLRSLLSLKWLVLMSLCAARMVPQPSAPLLLSGGLVRGHIAEDGSHVRYLAIPYATVTHRFQAAKPDPKWEGVYDAIDEHVRCKQRFTSNKISGVEDCLTANVYTPLPQSDSLLPVMVFIHGGGFRDGSGSPFIYGPRHLIKHGVILVTFNYRLEVLGFLCLGIKEAPGNIGLKDQVQALKWVKKNIKGLGGDPDNVTIFGESAGSSAVAYHLLSPMSQGLFNKAILQSGSALSPWALQFEPVKTARLLAAQMGYKVEDPQEIYNIFKRSKAEDLLKHRVPREKGDIVLSENIFVPCIEKSIAGVETFLPDNPYTLLSEGKYNKVPVIIGYNNREGYYFAGKENDTTLFNIDFKKALPRDLLFPTEKEKMTAAKTFNELYMKGEKISREPSALLKMAHYQGDAGIKYSVLATIDLFLKSLDKPIYAYEFSYGGFLNFAKKMFGFRKYPGATHADELFYMFSMPAQLNVERDMIEKMTSYWTNFAKYGNPTPDSSNLPKWEPAAVQDPRLMVIDKECVMAPVWGDEYMGVWNYTYSKYRRIH
ncbi:juvenile hormone esterase-like [Trichoplusia ni]|uniref:Juvenile hormone esterase-like n=1 Tax=Trichoplusia ni TaxID=7111 RepID=A0A7E5WU78_TRINI|nr:juvenile hormone esterase-like [Trichoplusia ni]